MTIYDLTVGETARCDIEAHGGYVYAGDKLVKIDKNETRTFSSCKCRRCGGTGLMPYKHIDDGICFKCDGSGVEPEYTYSIRTPEYEQKLADRRIAKLKKEAPKRNAEFFKKNGLSADGKAWIVAGNTYEIKDELKKAGAKYSPLLGWHFDHEISDYTCAELDISEVASLSIAGEWLWNSYTEVAEYCKAKATEAMPKVESEKTVSEYIGNVGEKIEAKVTFKRQFSFESHMGWMTTINYINTFVDENGNVLVWKTSSWQDIDEGNAYTIKGTIKDHNEYKGTKQTILTRCKITA